MTAGAERLRRYAMENPRLERWLDDVLVDPIIRAVMRRDGVTDAELRLVMHNASASLSNKTTSVGEGTVDVLEVLGTALLQDMDALAASNIDCRGFAAVVVVDQPTLREGDGLRHRPDRH